jgi:predicted site-specific integrase-resolvase
METRLAYKLTDAAAMLGVSITSLRRAIQRGQIKPCRKFRHIIIPSEELRRFLASNN